MKKYVNYGYDCLIKTEDGQQFSCLYEFFCNYALPKYHPAHPAPCEGYLNAIDEGEEYWKLWNVFGVEIDENSEPNGGFDDDTTFFHVFEAEGIYELIEARLYAYRLEASITEDGKQIIPTEVVGTILNHEKEACNERLELTDTFIKWGL